MSEPWLDPNPAKTDELPRGCGIVLLLAVLVGIPGAAFFMHPSWLPTLRTDPINRFLSPYRDAPQFTKIALVPELFSERERFEDVRQKIIAAGFQSQFAPDAGIEVYRITANGVVLCASSFVVTIASDSSDRLLAATAEVRADCL